MSQSTILGGDKAPQRAAGRDNDLLGPSDTSDTGSDIQHARSMPTAPDLPDEQGALPPELDSDSDALGTGERASADARPIQDGADIMPDRITGGPGGDFDPDALIADDDDTLAQVEEELDADEQDRAGT